MAYHLRVIVLDTKEDIIVYPQLIIYSPNFFVKSSTFGQIEINQSQETLHKVTDPGCRDASRYPTSEYRDRSR